MKRYQLPIRDDGDSHFTAKTGNQPNPDRKSLALKRKERTSYMPTGGDFDYTSMLSPEARDSYLKFKEKNNGNHDTKKTV